MTIGTWAKPGTPRAAYVGVDNRAAGRTAGLLMGLMAGSERRPVGLFTGSRAFQGHQERESGFRAVVEERFPLLRVLPPIETGEDTGRAFHAMRRLLRDQPDRDHRLQVVREGRSCEVELDLQLANAEAGIAGAHQRAIDAKACRVAEGFEAGGGIIEFHGTNIA